MLFANSYKNEGFILDLTQDVIKINKMALEAPKSGCLVLGGGVVKHHIMNANIWRNGADYGTQSQI
jgi:deoxyhypusine synthase